MTEGPETHGLGCRQDMARAEAITDTGEPVLNKAVPVSPGYCFLTPRFPISGYFRRAYSLTGLGSPEPSRKLFTPSNRQSASSFRERYVRKNSHIGEAP